MNALQVACLGQVKPELGSFQVFTENIPYQWKCNCDIEIEKLAGRALNKSLKNGSDAPSGCNSEAPYIS